MYNTTSLYISILRIKMITTYILTFDNIDKFDEFMDIVNGINTRKYNRFSTICILSIDALMYDGEKNIYMCIFNVNGKILNNDILRTKFNLDTYMNHPDKKRIYRALCEQKKINHAYHVFDNYDDMLSHFDTIIKFFPLVHTETGINC